MRIAVAVTDRTAHAPVCEHLEEARYLFIVETDRREVLKVLCCADTADPADPADLMCAQAAKDENCEAIICGDIELAAFDLLADNMITRFYGWGADASQAVSLMLEGRLPLLREARNGSPCQGEEHWVELRRAENAREQK